MNDRVAIRFAAPADETRLLDFLRDYWRSDHVFISNPELLRWQHKSPYDAQNELTFLIAERSHGTNDSEIMAILGFIPLRRFHGNPDWNEILLAIWKVRDDSNTPGLGIQMIKTLQREIKPEMIAAIGITDIVKPMYQALGYTLGHLSHAALFAQADPLGMTADLNVPETARAHIPHDQAVRLQKIEVSANGQPLGATPDQIEALAQTSAPRKSWGYLVERYLKHPWYRYCVQAVFVEDTLHAILVWRRVNAPFGDILRIVDIIGDPACLARCGAALRERLAQADCCYIDLMAWGVDLAALAKGGFITPDDHSDLVLPNYFSPYEAKNIKIDLAVKTMGVLKGQSVQLFRADSDQDRPNRPTDLIAPEMRHSHEQ